MGDLTLTERVYALEDQVRELRMMLTEHGKSVVLVEKQTPGPTVRTVRKKRKKKVTRKGPQLRRGFVKADA